MLGVKIATDGKNARLLSPPPVGVKKRKLNISREEILLGDFPLIKDQPLV